MGFLLQDDLFNVSEIAEVNNKIKEKAHAEAVIQAQAVMQLPFFDCPKNDNEKLLNLQYEYIKNHDQKKWGELLSYSYLIIKRLIWKVLKEQKNIFLDEIEQDEKASIALHYVMRRYQTRIGYYVEKNYISFLKGGVKHALRYQTELDKNTISLDGYLERKEKR